MFTVKKEKEEELLHMPATVAPIVSALNSVLGRFSLDLVKLVAKYLVLLKHSFTFSPVSLHGGKWNCKGLYLDPSTGCIIARAYDQEFYFKDILVFEGDNGILVRMYPLPGDKSNLDDMNTALGFDNVEKALIIVPGGFCSLPEYHKLDGNILHIGKTLFGRMGTICIGFDYGQDLIFYAKVHEIEVIERSSNKLIHTMQIVNPSMEFGIEFMLVNEKTKEIFLIINNTRQEILVVDYRGTIQRRFGTLGLLNGQFNGLASVIIDSDDNLLICDSGNDRIQIFSQIRACRP